MWRHDAIAREQVADAVDEFPRTDVGRGVEAIVNFNVFVVRIARERIVHDLVDDDAEALGRAVGSAQRAACKAVVIRPAIRRAAAGNGIGLAAEVNGVDHAVLVGVDEVNALAFGQ